MTSQTLGEARSGKNPWETPQTGLENKDQARNDRLVWAERSDLGARTRGAGPRVSMGPWYWEARAHLSSHITLPGFSLWFQSGHPWALRAPPLAPPTAVIGAGLAGPRPAPGDPAHCSDWCRS